MTAVIVGWFVMAVFVGQALASPVYYHEPEGRPLAVVSDLGQRLVSHSRSQDASIIGGDPRLPIPTLQELDAIKKVAQILVMLGEQVIPTIIGDIAPQSPHANNCDTVLAEDVPNDPVNQN